MDLSALIFVALAVAWAAYLIPKALRHHEDGASSRTVEGFSTRLRVLARRESADGRTARLVVEGERTSAPEPEAAPVPERRPVPVAVRRAAAARAAARRRRVVLAILLVGVVVAALATASVVSWVSMTGPGVVLVAWLVACRLMVKKERAAVVVRPQRTVPAPRVEAEPVADDDPVTEEIRVELQMGGAPAEPAAATSPEPEPEPEPVDEQADEQADEQRADGWEPRPTTLPTYVTKEPAARRTVRTIDLDSTGVWTSGPHAGDSALAREADAERAERATRPEQAERKRRAAGD